MAAARVAYHLYSAAPVGEGEGGPRSCSCSWLHMARLTSRARQSTSRPYATKGAIDQPRARACPAYPPRPVSARPQPATRSRVPPPSAVQVRILGNDYYNELKEDLTDETLAWVDSSGEDLIRAPHPPPARGGGSSEEDCLQGEPVVVED